MRIQSCLIELYSTLYAYDNEKSGTHGVHTVRYTKLAERVKNAL